MKIVAMKDTKKDHGIVIVKRLGSKINDVVTFLSIPIVNFVVVGMPRRAPTVVVLLLVVCRQSIKM
eukprot:3091314-Amphidinium_carterae.1